MKRPKIRGTWYANVLNTTYRLALFIALLLLALMVYDYLLRSILVRQVHVVPFVAFWLFSAYLVLPRVNRRLSRIYIPEYFIGRTRTADGLLGDPINLAVRGSRDKLIAAMEQAGWTQAEPLNLKSSLKMTYTSVLGRSYPSAPVSSLFVFGNQQDLAFQREIGGNPRKRHHVRFWKTPEDWWLPGGYQADWLGAGTYDKNVGLSLYTGQITHKIDADIDAERDFILRTLQDHHVKADVEMVKHFTTSFHARNGGGDRIHTDGSLPFINL